jgi:hypothetical protein
MTGLRTAILGAMATVVGISAATATAVGSTVPGVETFARVHPSVLIVGGLLALIATGVSYVAGGETA